MKCRRCHTEEIWDQARALGAGPEAVLGGERRQPLIPGGRLGEGIALRRERVGFQQLTWSGQPPAVSHGSGFYEKGRPRYGYPWSPENR